MFRFASAHIYAVLFFVLLLLVGIYILRALYSRFVLKRSYSPRISNFYFGSINFFSFGFARFFFFVLGVILAIFSLMQPQWGKKKLSQKGEGIEIVFVLDISMSMAAEDVKPSRLKLAKLQLNKVFEALQGNKMGLVAFAGQVGVVSPLTQDMGALALFLDSLDFETISEQGTNIKDALTEAKELLMRGGEKGTQKSNQAVVLITDGEDHSSDSLSEAKALYHEGVRTFVIGVGTRDGARIPIRDSFDQVVGYLTDRKDQPVITKPDFKFLRSIAKAGHGSFYTMGFGSKMIGALQSDLSKIKSTGFEAQSFDVQDEYFQYPLLVSILCFFLSLIFTPTGKSKPIRSLKYIEDMND